MPAPKFRYYITDLYEGYIRGTNEESVAHEFAQTCDYFVVDTETNKMLCEDGTTNEVVEV